MYLERVPMSASIKARDKRVKMAIDHHEMAVHELTFGRHTVM
jgi:hypothetical protein